ncbi:IclR family transcriptional regulator [Brevibacterium yomogidense]|uniref:IclR family transcriptional regulator n=1 Tax=Brevibacterium yomogidense TaxID=946573 RepID=UPI000B34ABEF|nr:IclR family transcriptional regulator [Brevibacterium yomogidense]
MANDEGTSPRNDVVSAVMRACDLMSRFSPDQELWTLAELTKATGLNRTTAYRLVNTLVDAGWLVRIDETHFGVDWRVYRIGASAYSRNDLRGIVRPHLQRLADTFGDTAYFMIPDEQSVACVDMVVGHSPLQIHGMQIGSRLPLNAAAAPLAMLARSPALLEQAMASPLKSYTEQSITDSQTLKETVGAVRRDGYAVSRDDFLNGVSAVAVAVMLGEDLFGTVSLGGASVHFGYDDLQRRIGGVRVAAQELSAQLETMPQAHQLAPWITAARS